MAGLNNDNKPRRNLEFGLVVIMLGVLVALVILILVLDINGGIDGAQTATGKDSTTITLDAAMEYREQALNFRKELLTVIITAFGAWVGAGAAYFFGRENLRVASESMLAMREKTPRERLSEMRVGDSSPRLIKNTTDAATTMDVVGKLVVNDRDVWYIPVVDGNGALQTVIHEELVWRYLATPPPAPVPTLGAYITTAKSDPKLARLIDIYVTVTPNNTLAEAETLLTAKECYLAVVVDAQKKPTHIITTGDVRKALLGEPGTKAPA